MKNVYIVGGEGFALECAFYLKRMMSIDREINFSGFLGESGFVPRLGKMQSLFKGDCDNMKFEADDALIIGSGNVEIRARLFEKFFQKMSFFTLCDPTAVISPDAEIGQGNIFAPFTVVSPQVRIGNANIFNCYSFSAHHSVVGSYNFIAPQAQLLGGAKINDLNSIGTGAILLPHSNIGSNNKISPLSAVYKGCKEHCILHGNPAKIILKENNESH